MPDLIFSGKYVVQQEIAKGGMGVIYKALDRTLNRLVAIKVVHEHFAGDASFTERFIREARAMARLHHENIVTIFSVEEDRGAPFIVMEYFPGIDLRSRIKAHAPLTLRESLDVTVQIANALAFAHSQGIVHRDIKPANILVDARGRVKLTDFGIAAALDEVSITSTGQIIGTPEYMSPEQAGGMEVDGRTDLYSLGIVLHEMIAGHTPFHSLPKTGILGRLLDPQYEIPLTVPPETPSGVKAIVEDLVRRNPDYRTPRAAILAGQLKECFASLPIEENGNVHTMIATMPTHPARQTKLSTLTSRRSLQSDSTTDQGGTLVPSPPSPPARPSSDEATDVLSSPRVESQASVSVPPPAHRRRIHAASIAIAILVGLIGLGALAYYFVSPVTTAPPNAVADGSITVNGQSKESVLPDDPQARLAKEQEQLAIDEARVAAKRREAEALRKKENEQAAKQATIAEEQRKKTEDAARTARQRQEAEQRKFAEEQKRLEKDKQLAAAQALAAEEQRRKAQEEARLARQREELEARTKEEADMKRLQEERQRLERERELAEERARLAEAQRKKAEEEARLAQVRHEEEQRRLQADQQRIEKENELAAQRAQIQEEERRRAAEEARIERQRLEAEQKRLQAERDRLDKEKEQAAERARLEAEERRRAGEEARVVRQRNEAEQKRLQAERERVEKERDLAAQRAKAELDARRKSEEEARAAREAEQRQLQAERDRLENEKREAAAQLTKADEEARRRQEEDQRSKDQLIVKLTPGASQRQLDNLLDQFKRAYEGHDVATLRKLSDMSSDRLTFLDTMFANYPTIQVAIENLKVKDREASATIIHKILVNQNGDYVMPSPILRAVRIKIYKTGEQWSKIEWVER